MRVTAFSDYALRVLMYLALDEQRRTTVAEIAEAYRISVHHLTKVVHLLGRAGWVETVRGRGGGLRLGMPPGEIRVGDVVRRCEGDMPVAECRGNPPIQCRIATACRLANFFDAAVEAFYAELNRHTVADLMQRPHRQALHRILMPETAE